jgi:hypothetical protein
MTLSSTVQPAANIIVSCSRADQAQKDREHPDDRQPEHCIEHRRPSDTVDHSGGHDAAEHDQRQQRQCVTHALRAAQQFLFVAHLQAAHQ